MSSQAGPSNREELIRNAVLFLNDPKVQSSSLTSRIQFLESKGLTEPEIQRALAEVQDGPSARSPPPPPGVPGYDGYGGGGGGGYGYGQMTAPPPPRRDWRDLFIMAVVSGGVVYGLTALARKYLVPHLSPPSQTSFQSTSTSLTASYDEASRLLSELQEQTTALQTSVETDRERVGHVVEEVEEALKGLKEGEEGWRNEMREMRGEVEGVRDLVPRMIEKHAASQSAALQDLQNELRSLKTLLQARQLAPPPASSAPNGNGAASATTEAANNLLKGKGRGIPAWQLAGNGGTDGASGRSSPAGTGSLSGSGILEKDKEEGSSEEART